MEKRKFCIDPVPAIPAFLQPRKFETLIEKKSIFKKDWLLRNSWPIGANNILFALCTQADLWIVSLLLEAQELAVYGLATRIALLATLAQAAARGVLQAQVPAFMLNRDIKGLQQLMYNVSHSNFYFSILVFFAFLLFGNFLADLLYGAFYTKLWLPCLILLAGRVVVAFLGQNMLLLNLTDHAFVLIRSDFLWLTIFLPLLWLSTSLYGIYGAAAANSVFIIARSANMAVLVKRIFGFWPFIKPI